MDRCVMSRTPDRSVVCSRMVFSGGKLHSHRTVHGSLAILRVAPLSGIYRIDQEHLGVGMLVQ